MRVGRARRGHPRLRGDRPGRSRGGGNPRGRFCFTLTVTDIATGWAENRTVRDKRQVNVIAAVTDVVEHLQFPIKSKASTL